MSTSTSPLTARCDQKDGDEAVDRTRRRVDDEGRRVERVARGVGGDTQLINNIARGA